MICQLTSEIHCPGRREAELYIKWTIDGDVDAESVICYPCYEGRPRFVKIIEKRAVREGDRTSR